MTDITVDRRQRLAQNRRKSILDAAARVFARRGYERATTREIAAEAGVSEGTIYTYFASKQELLTELAGEFQAQLARAVPTDSAEGEMRQVIVDAVSQVLEVIASNATLVRGLLTAVWDHGYGFHGYMLPGTAAIVDQVEGFLASRVALGAMKPCDVHAVARMAMGMVIYLAAPYVQEIEPFPSALRRRELSELLVTILFEGLQS